MRKDKVVSEVLGGEAALAPSDLYAREFKRVSFGGYDPGEVHGFLEKVADQFEGQVNQMRALKDESRVLEEQLNAGRQLQDSLRQALTDAHNLSEGILLSARHEADAILESARTKHEEAEAKAQARMAAVVQEVRALAAQRSQLRDELLAVVESHRAMLGEIVPADAGDSVDTDIKMDAEAQKQCENEEDVHEEPVDAAVAVEDVSVSDCEEAGSEGCPEQPPEAPAQENDSMLDEGPSDPSETATEEPIAEPLETALPPEPDETPEPERKGKRRSRKMNSRRNQGRRTRKKRK